MESTMTTCWPRTLTAVVLAATGLLLAGCSSSSHQAATGTLTSATSASAARTPPSSDTPASSGAQVSRTGTPVDATSSTASSGTTSACALITEQEATTALGADPGAGEEIPGHCIYAAGASSMNIIVRPLPDGAVGFNNLRTAQGSHAVDVAGMGDGAFGVFEGPIAVVTFYKAHTTVAIELALSGASASASNKVTALAKLAADRV
jgi:hypothetical protein